MIVRARIANRRAGGSWWRIPLALLLWLVIAGPIAALVTGVVIVRRYAADLPRVPDLERWEADVPRTSVIVAADGTVLAELPFRRGVEVGHRFPVRYSEVPELMVQAILAAEDTRFFAHEGVDYAAVMRAAWANYQAGRVVEGASTITQQVARNLLPEQIGYERSLRRKVREALLARRIDARYSKERIFEVYANHVFLGASAYGIAAAARAYFDTELGALTLPQTALIAGLAQAPGRADPYKNREAARERRDEILQRMARAGFIDAAAAAHAQAAPIALRPPPQRYGTLAPWHTERARRELEQANPLVYARGGLRIETAAAPVLAMTAEAQARRWTERLGRSRDLDVPQAAAVIWDHRTGYIEATLGGRSWQQSRFDRATQACRQPGSAFKPILYAAAIEAGAITPATALRDAPIAEYDQDKGVHWKPDNSGRSFRGVALAQEALALSLNAPAVDVLDRVGAERVGELAERLGIDSELADVRPLALGASCVIPLELASAYAAFARRGSVTEPIFVTRVTHGDEVLLDRASPYDPTLAPARRLDRLVASVTGYRPPDMDPASAFLMSSMLAAVVERGTATDARALGRPTAGKTGTTNDNTDAWFVGFTGRVVVAVWVGHDDPQIKLGRRQGGAHAALPLWMRLVELAERGRPPASVPGEPPQDVVRVRVDTETGNLARPGAGGAVDVYVKRGTEPTTYAGQPTGVPANIGRMSREF